MRRQQREVIYEGENCKIVKTGKDVKVEVTEPMQYQRRYNRWSQAWESIKQR